MLREWSLSTNLIGRRILAFDCVDSTNTVAAGYATDSMNDGLVIVADEQSAGRGRQGRTWISPPGSNVLLSVLLFPPEHLRRPVILTTLAAVAVCETIYQCTKLQATIKWPNDVLVRGRKLCGVLVEQGRGTVIGIGLNVNTPAEAFGAAGLRDAGSLAMHTGHALDRRRVIETLLLQLDAGYGDLLNGLENDLQTRWRWHSGLLGKQVAVHHRGCATKGRLADLSFAAVILQDARGHMVQFSPEDIEQIMPL